MLGKIFGGNHKFEHNGKAYSVSLITEGVRSQYEKTLYEAAKARLQATQEVLHPDDYRRQCRRLGNDYLAGKFALGKQIADANLHLEGGVLLVSLLFGCSQDEALKLMIERSDDIAQLFRVVKDESFGSEPEGEVKKKLTTSKKKQTTQP